MKTNQKLTGGKESPVQLIKSPSSLFPLCTPQSPHSGRPWLLLAHFPTCAPFGAVGTPAPKQKAGLLLCRDVLLRLPSWETEEGLGMPVSSCVDARREAQPPCCREQLHSSSLAAAAAVAIVAKLYLTPWTGARQAPLSMGFPRQEYWNGLPCPSPGDLPDPEIKPVSLESSALAGGFCTSEPPGKPPLTGFLAKHSPSQQDKIGRTQGVWGYFLCPECSSSLRLEN